MWIVEARRACAALMARGARTSPGATLPGARADAAM
jgi:hypothetical protein